MKTFEYTIKDELGIHARPAGLLVKEAKKYESECTITKDGKTKKLTQLMICLLYTSPSPRDRTRSRMPSSA